ncbi:MAG: P1 family peptidase [Pseudomonadota bacterium]
MTTGPGPRNLITDVAGLRVGHASDDRIKTGVTVLTADAPFTTAAHVMGGAPGTRETDLLAPDKLVQQADALVLAGGSAFGLDAASGVMAALRAAGRGYPAGTQNGTALRVPIVPAAILFDLKNGGAKDWQDSPYAELGRMAFAEAGPSFALGSCGAGTGALTATVKGGLGSASSRVGGYTLGALAAVNAVGSPLVGDGPHFWAAPFEVGGEFGGLGFGAPPEPASPPRLKDRPHPGGATTLAIVATDAALTQAEAQRLATAAHDGLARALVPAHTPVDGDIVFAVSTGAVPLADPIEDAILLGHAASVCLARAVARGIFAATPAEGDPLPTWHQIRETAPPAPRPA